MLLTFRPYKGGNARLRAIHDLDINDKHRAVLETEKVMNIQLSGYYDITDLSKHSLSLEGSTIEHLFSADSSLAKMPIIQTLKELVELVEGILNAFADLTARMA